MANFKIALERWFLFFQTALKHLAEQIASEAAAAKIPVHFLHVSKFFLMVSLPGALLPFAHTAKADTPGVVTDWDCNLTINEEEFCQPLAKLGHDPEAARVKKECLLHYRGTLGAVRRICETTKPNNDETNAAVAKIEQRLIAKGIEGQKLWTAPRRLDS